MIIATIFFGSCSNGSSSTGTPTTVSPSNQHRLTSGNDYMIVTIQGQNGNIYYQGQTYPMAGQNVSYPDGGYMGTITLTTAGATVALRPTSTATISVFGPGTYFGQ